MGGAGAGFPWGSPKVCAFGQAWPWGPQAELTPPPQLGVGLKLQSGRDPPLGAPPSAHFLPRQIKSDKQELGSVIYSIQGPGVDEEPRGVFSIDKFTGKVFLNDMLDREKTDRFRVSCSPQQAPDPLSGEDHFSSKISILNCGGQGRGFGTRACSPRMHLRKEQSEAPRRGSVVPTGRLSSLQQGQESPPQESATSCWCRPLPPQPVLPPSGYVWWGQGVTRTPRNCQIPVAAAP